MMKTSRGKGVRYVLLFLIVIIGLTAIIFSFIHKSPEQQAKEAIDLFYTYEQEGAYSDSWAMFHPYMQEKFSKAHYIQDRAHVFMNHFGVSTFAYTLEDVIEVANWKIEAEADPMEVVYKVQVSQAFAGKYGNFTIVQDVYAVELDGEWKVLWDYNR